MDHEKPSDALEAADAVLRFLASVGPSSEAEFYLRLFRSRAAESFATIAVEAAALEQNASGVAVDLRFLNGLGLTPVVVVGLDEHEHAAAHRDKLQALLRKEGLQSEAFDGEPDSSAVALAARSGRIPLLAASGGEHHARIANLGRLLGELCTHKLIFLGPEGGLRLRGDRISVVNLSADYDALSANEALNQRQRELLADSHRLVFELVEHPLLISMTSPLNLLHELFTVKGAGTLLRRGARVTRHAGYDGVDLGRLSKLLTASFGRPPIGDFFARPLEHAYIEENYRGAALVMRAPLGGYLSKFAVTREAQGEGIGQDLWTALAADHPALIWRSRSENPIRVWYERQCQGRFETGLWTVYVRGIEPPQIAAAIDFALAQPVDL